MEIIKKLKSLFTKKSVIADDVNKPIKEEKEHNKPYVNPNLMKAYQKLSTVSPHRKTRKRKLFVHNMRKYNFGNFSSCKPFQVNGRLK